MIKRINFKEAKHILDTDKTANIVDVREEEEFITGHAENAVNFPVDSIDKSLADFLLPDKKAPVLVYCRTGSRSCLAAERLYELGYENIYDLGSLSSWPYGLYYDV